MTKTTCLFFLSLFLAFGFLEQAGASTTRTVCLDGSCDHTSVQAAIDASFDGDLIEVSGETYLLDDTIDTLGKAVTIRGAVDEDGEPLTVLDGQEKVRVLRVVTGEGLETAFENLVIRNGFATWMYPANEGGGLYCSSSDPSLTNCTFTNNFSSGKGGGLYCLDSSPTLTNCTITSNTASGEGGGLYCSSSSPSLITCSFLDNTTLAVGGGLFCSYSSLSLTDCVIVGNNASSSGAGLYCIGSSSNILTNCTFTGNTATKFGGGMLCAYSSSTLTNCTFTHNAASMSGGGMVSNTGSSTMLVDCTVCGNEGGQVSGTYVDVGGNCLSVVCTDLDGDGSPDCADGSDLDLQVPDEYPTIEAAIDAAAQGGVITIAAGVYQPGGTLEFFGKALTLRGSLDSKGQPATIIDAQGVRRVLQCSNDNETNDVLENLVIRNGHAVLGGGLYCAHASPSLTNCSFTGNTAVNGGGMFCADDYYYASTATLKNCTFTENTATQSGGGMYSSGNSLTLTNCTLSNNTSKNIGGGICLLYGSDTTINESQICGNTPDQIYGDWIGSFTCVNSSCVDGTCDPETFTVCPTGCDYDDINDAIVAAKDLDVIEVSPGTYVLNRAIDTMGKQIRLIGAVDQSGEPLTVLDGAGKHRVMQCSYSDGRGLDLENFVFRDGYSDKGGGLYLSEVQLRLANCTFTGNFASEHGGGLYCFLSETLFVDCTFSENIALLSGGGVYARSSLMTLSECTFTGNMSGTKGGGLLHSGSVTLTGCTFSYNHSETLGGGVYCAGDLLLIGCSLIENSALVTGGGLWITDNTFATLSNTLICGNTLDQLVGPHEANGASCILDSCIEDCVQCPADFTDDHLVDGADLSDLLGFWGNCTSNDCPPDLDGNGQVDGVDLLELLSAWGPCS